MIDRLLVAAVCIWLGLTGLTPEQPKSPTTANLIYKAKMQSVSNVCDKPRKSKNIKEICRRWERQRGSK